MKIIFSALLSMSLFYAAAPACAWRMFGEPSDGKIRPIQKLNDEHKSAEVLARLTPDFIQTLRGTDLRQAYVLLGDNHIALGRSAEALGDYQLGVSLFPKNVDLLTRLATLLHNNGLDEQARPLYMTALKYEPRHWGAHLGLAGIEGRLGLLDRAASHYKIALEAIGKRADVWRDYAEVLLALHRNADADLALQRALDLDPKNLDTRVLLALRHRDAGDLAGAIDQLDLAKSLSGSLGVRRAKALFLLEAGRFDQARAESDVILAESESDGVALWVRARISLAEGDAAGAARALSEVKPANGDGTFAAQAAHVLHEAILSPRREDTPNPDRK